MKAEFNESKLKKDSAICSGKELNKCNICEIHFCWIKRIGDKNKRGIYFVKSSK